MNSFPSHAVIDRKTKGPSAAYIHVPFCAHRCGYCDFTLISGRDDLIGDYLRTLEREIERAEIPSSVRLETLFLGGGTPTHPAPPELAEMLRIIRRQFQFTGKAEISVEANPLDLSDEKIGILIEGGVNRVSLGVQSFSAAALSLLERNHTPAQIVDVVQRLQRRLKNISLDLIFGVPGQSSQQWRETVRRAIDLGPTHLSTYGLTFEPGTAFWTRRERGDMTHVDDELEREQYAIAMEELPQAGYVQYEISSFAQPGYECRHNHVYWSGEEFLAFGPGAASYLNGRRETNIRSVIGWLTRIDGNQSPVAETEELEPEHRARELVYLGLRRNCGIARDHFRRQTGFDVDQLCGKALQQQVELGLIEDDGRNIRLSPAGRFVADRVIMEFL